MKRYLVILAIITLSCLPGICYGEEPSEFQTQAPVVSAPSYLRLRTNALPWLLAVPNIGAEFCFAPKWSAVLDVWYCPWVISQKFSVKTASILPELRWWFKSTQKGSFFNLHLNIGWFNVRANHRRYQDAEQPYLGGGIGYGYRIDFNRKWGMEFEIGAGVTYLKYDRFYNVKNGALIDTRQSTYFGIDRASVTFTYYLTEL